MCRQEAETERAIDIQDKPLHPRGATRARKKSRLRMKRKTSEISGWAHGTVHERITSSKLLELQYGVKEVGLFMSLHGHHLSHRSCHQLQLSLAPPPLPL